MRPVVVRRRSIMDPTKEDIHVAKLVAWVQTVPRRAVEIQAGGRIYLVQVNPTCLHGEVDFWERQLNGGSHPTRGRVSAAEVALALVQAEAVILWEGAEKSVYLPDELVSAITDTNPLFLTGAFVRSSEVIRVAAERSRTELIRSAVALINSLRDIEALGYRGYRGK